MKENLNHPSPSESGGELDREPTTAPAGDQEPTSEPGSVPVWLIVLFGLLFFGGELYLDRHAGGFSKDLYEPFATQRELKLATPKTGGLEERIENGQQLFAACAACHQASGLGVPGTFPPLAGSEWVLEESPVRIIRAALYGLNGPIEVKGQHFQNVMTPMGKAGGGVYTDEQIADVLTYIRQAWGNKASPVTTEQVKAVQDAVGDRGGKPFTAEELLQIPLDSAGAKPKPVSEPAK